jgi:hypothetical protein
MNNICVTSYNLLPNPLLLLYLYTKYNIYPNAVLIFILLKLFYSICEYN